MQETQTHHGQFDGGENVAAWLFGIMDDTLEEVAEVREPDEDEVLRQTNANEPDEQAPGFPNPGGAAEPPAPPVQPPQGNQAAEGQPQGGDADGDEGEEGEGEGDADDDDAD